MKKAFLGVLIIISIGVITAPFLNGLMMEKMLRSQLKKVNELYADQPFSPNFEITRYDRGFGSSEIEWTITMPQMQAIGGINPIILVEKAKHGYMGVSSTTSLNQNSWYTDFIREKLDSKDPLSISSRYNLLSGVTGTVSLEPLELLDDKNNRFIISPGELVIKTDRSFENVLTKANFEGISVPGEIDIKGIALHSDMKVISSLIMDGKSSLSIQQVSIKGSNKRKAVAISSIKGASTLEFDETNKKLSMNTEYSVDQIVTGEKKVDDISIRVGINQLDSDSFENVYKAYINILSDMLTNFATVKDNPEQAKAMMNRQMALVGMRLMPEVEKLFKKDLQIVISDLHLTLPQGEVEGDFAISLKKDMTLADFIALTQQPEKLVEVFSFASNMTLPDGLVASQDNLLVPMLPGMQTGVFEKLGEKLVHKTEIKDNKLLLNNQEFILRPY
jgi:uncharacterized protein YdgA (DUF945 family)